MVRFCSGHSPPLSQTGQSSGCEVSRNSRISFCEALALSDWLSTTMPSETGVVQAVSSFGPKLIFGLSSIHHRLTGGAVHHRAANFDQALAAHADRLHLRVVAEDRDVNADLLGSVYDQRASRDSDWLSVNRQGYHFSHACLQRGRV